MSDRFVNFRHQPRVQFSCIGLVDDVHKTIVTEDGSLNYLREDGENVTYVPNAASSSIPQPERFTANNARSVFDFAVKPCLIGGGRKLHSFQEYGDPRIALVTTTEQYEHATLQWDAFAYRERDSGFRADIILITKPWLISAFESEVFVELQASGPSQRRPPIICSEDRRVFVVILNGALDHDVLSHEWGVRARESTRRYWLRIPAVDTLFHVPSHDIQSMLNACQRNILQARDIQNECTTFQVGPTVYRGLWAVDGYFLLEAAQFIGYGEDAIDQGLRSIVSRMNPDGSLEILSRHYKETGIAIATIVRQCELRGENAKLRSYWPVILQAVSHIKTLRHSSYEIGAMYPARGLFPPAFLDGGISGPYPDYTTPSWILVGLKMAYEAGRRMGMSETNQIQTLYNDIYSTFLRCAHRDRTRTPQGHYYLPMAMEDSSCFPPQAATWALAHAIYPGEIFEPDDQLVLDMLNLVDATAAPTGIPSNTGWLHRNGVWAYSASFYAHAFLYAGFPMRTISYLYAFANHAAPARVWREEQSILGGSNPTYCGDMPHNWASAEFIRLVRNMVVMERRGGLEVFAALPYEWLPSAGNDLVLRKTPTRYGQVDVTLSSNNRGYTLFYRRTAGGQRPSHIAIHWNGSVNNTLIPADSHKATLHLDPISDSLDGFAP